MNPDHLVDLLPLQEEKRCLWDNCNLEFHTNQECFEHVKSFHSIKKHGRCMWKDCKYSGKIATNINNHIKKHFNIIEGLCTICKVCFKWRFDLLKHIRNYHSSESNIMTKTMNITNLTITVAFEEKQQPSSIQMLLN